MFAWTSAGLPDDLSALVGPYVDAHDLCEKQAERLRLHAHRFSEWRPPQNETGVHRINKWLASLAATMAPSTVNNHRTSVLSLIRHAVPDDAPLPRTDKIRRQKEPDLIRLAYTLDELRQCLAAAPSYQPLTHRLYGRGIKGDTIPRHRPDGIHWSIWWEAFVRVGYESGQYLSDLRLIPWKHVASDGRVTFVRHKTGKRNSFQLSQGAIMAARGLQHSELLLPWSFDMAAYFAREWRKFAKHAGVRELEPKAIRRSAITYTYIEHGEESARLLAGHDKFATTAKHYIDWTIASRPTVKPPALDDFTGLRIAR